VPQQHPLGILPREVKLGLELGPEVVVVPLPLQDVGVRVSSALQCCWGWGYLQGITGMPRPGRLDLF